jgi:hypothetical protein
LKQQQHIGSPTLILPQWMKGTYMYGNSRVRSDND